MRLVVDTNVFVSAAIKDSSSPADIVRWIAEFGGLLKSVATEKEVMEVLRRRRFALKIAPFFLHNMRRMFVTSGDADLLVHDSFRGIPLITPAAFS